jgi:hypothetical protein
MLRFTSKEISYLLKTVRERMADLGMGFHRYFLMRSNKSMTEEELLPKMKAEKSLLTSIRNKLWRMKRDDTDTPP